MTSELNIELYEKLRRLSRRFRHMHHAGDHMPECPPEHRGHGPMDRMMPPEGRMPEAGPFRPHPHRKPRFHRERILAVLNEREDGLHQKDLAQILMINPSSLSEAIDKLEADRYLERTVDPEDRRATIIRLTEKGKARAYEVEDERNAAIEEFFKDLNEEEKVQLLSLVDRLLKDDPLSKQL